MGPMKAMKAMKVMKTGVAKPVKKTLGKRRHTSRTILRKRRRLRPSAKRTRAPKQQNG